MEVSGFPQIPFYDTCTTLVCCLLLTLTDSGIDERKDANWAHMKEFESTLGKALTQFFGEYGEKQVHLWLLVTHPDYRRRGAATMLCHWGFEKAKEKSWVLTVWPVRVRNYSMSIWATKFWAQPLFK